MPSLTLQLQPVAPFRLDLTVWVLRRRSHNLMDRWEGDTYQRVLLVEDRPLEVAVSQTGPPETPELQVEFRGILARAGGADVSVGQASPPAGSVVEILTATLTRILGLDLDLQNFYRFASLDPRLQALVQDFRGVKPPRFPSLFEALVNAIACQQISLTAGLHVLNRLVLAFGPIFPDGPGPARAFPRPRDLAELAPQDLRDLGFSYSKARSIIELSQAVAAGNFDLEGLEALDDAAAVQALTQLRGIGRWTAEYSLLRGLGRIHLFPGDDVGARQKLQAWLNLTEPLDYAGVRRVLAGFQPFGGLVYFHLLLSNLAETRQLGGSPGERR